MKIIILYDENYLTPEFKEVINKAIRDTIQDRSEEKGEALESIDYQLIGNDYKELKEILEENNGDNEAMKTLKSADKDTLVMIAGHGFVIRDNSQKRAWHMMGGYSDDADLLNALPPEVKNIKIISCWSGSIFRKEVKATQGKLKWKVAKNMQEGTKDRLIATNTNSKDRALINFDVEDIAKLIKNSSLEIISGEKITPKRAIIMDALASPLSKYLSYDDPSGEPKKTVKLSRLFRGVKLEEAIGKTPEELVNDFIDTRKKELLELFKKEPEEQEFIEEFVKQKRPELREKIIRTAPHLYASKDNLKVIRILAACGFDLLSNDTSNVTPLHYVSYEYNTTPDIVEFFLNQVDENGEKIIDLQSLDKDDKTILDRTIEFNHHDTLQLLLDRGLDPNTKNFKGDTALLTACKFGNKKTVEIVANHPNINLDLMDDNLETPLLYCAKINNIEIMKTLLLFNLDPNIQNKFDETALMQSCINGNLEAVQLLVIYPDILLDIPDISGDTPLLYSCRAGNMEIARHLLVAGADPNFKNAKGETALMEAYDSGNKKMLDLLFMFDQTDTNIEDKDGYTILSLACLSNDKEMVGKILDHPKTDPNYKNKYGETALIQVVTLGKKEMVSLLLENSKTDNEIQDNYGQNALMIACAKGFSEITEEILSKGANPNIVNNEGNTALKLACQNGHANCVEQLLKVPGIKLPNFDEIGEFLSSTDKEKSDEIKTLIITHLEKLELKEKNTPKIRPIKLRKPTMEKLDLKAEVKMEKDAKAEPDSKTEKTLSSALENTEKTPSSIPENNDFIPLVSAEHKQESK